MALVPNCGRTGRCRGRGESKAKLPACHTFARLERPPQSGLAYFRGSELDHATAKDGIRRTTQFGARRNLMAPQSLTAKRSEFRSRISRPACLLLAGAASKAADLGGERPLP